MSNAAINTVRKVRNEVRYILRNRDGMRMRYDALINEVARNLGRRNDNHRLNATIESMVVFGGLRKIGSFVELQSDVADSQPATSTASTSSSDGRSYLRNRVQELAKSLDDVNKAKADVDAALAAANKALEDKATIIEEVHVYKTKTKKPATKIKEIFHREFKTLLDLAKARMNIFMYGPTGCGKSHIGEQMARCLGLPFYFISCTAGMSEGQVGGRLLPVGDQGTFEYVTSEFVKAYENGGVFLLDEIDAADPNVLLFINAALANGKVAVANRPEKPYAEKHADFICIAAANTAGTGADRFFSGRSKLDGATLDRFQMGKVQLDYDDRVEAELCPDDELRNHCLKIRNAINDHRLERAMSTRFMRDSYKMKTEFGWDQAQIDKAFFCGWREDEINKVKAALAA